MIKIDIVLFLRRSKTNTLFSIALNVANIRNIQLQSHVQTRVTEKSLTPRARILMITDSDYLSTVGGGVILEGELYQAKKEKA